MRRGPGTGLVVTLIYLCVHAIPSPNADAQEIAPAAAELATPDRNAVQLLIRSYLSARNFTPQQRAFQLILLSEAAIKIEPSLTRLWSQEAFQLAFTLPMSWNRVAHEKNALAAMAQVDPVLAFKLFDSMDPTPPMPSGDVPEDLRAYGAITIFREYWKRTPPRALDDIHLQAQRLAATGQYPFLAMVPIILDIAHLDHLQAQSLFEEALTNYSSGRRADNTDDEFSRFLNQLWEVMPRPVERQALQMAVSRLTNEPKESESKVYLSRVSSSKGSAEFRSRARELLYSLLPRIREIDPNWAEQFTQDYPDLKQASAGSGQRDFSQQVMIQNPTGAPTGDVSVLQAAALERTNLSRIAKLAATDPNQALAVAVTLSDVALRDEALAVVALSLAQNDPQRARSLVERVGKDFDALGSTPEKLPLLVKLASAAGVNHDDKVLFKAMNQAFDLGEELFSEDMDVHPGKPVFDVSGFDELSELTAIGVKFAPDVTLARINRISNDLLRAHLLIPAAEAVFTAQSAARSQAN